MLNPDPYAGFPRGFGAKTIVCDPPWEYKQKFRPGTHVPYETMSDREIFELPVGEAAAKDALLLMWFTNAHVGLALECVRNYGFEPKTILTWVKVTKAGKPHPGSGFWLRGSTEHAFLCTKGRPRCIRSRAVDGEKIPLYTTAMLAPRGKHSEKPVRSYVMMEDIGEPPRLDLFARRRRVGWETWGNAPIAHSQGTLRELPGQIQPVEAKA